MADAPSSEAAPPPVPAAEPTQPTPPPVTEPSFPVVRVAFNGQTVPILLQGENGPCPLLALVNTLFLRGQIELGAGATEVTQDRLLSILANHILNRADRLAAGPDAAAANNVAANVEAALERVPKLATGIDVNIRFAHPRSVEFTDEVALFDLAGVGLVHGWVMTQDDEESSLLGTDASYNATAALAVEAGCNGGSGEGGSGAVLPPPRPPPRSLLDEDWPPGPPAAAAATSPSAPPLPGLEPVLSADLADALEAKVGLGDRRRTASSNGGGENGAAVSALVAAALAKAAAAAAAAAPATATTTATPPPPPMTTTTTTTTTASDPSRTAKAVAAASWLARTATQLTHAGLVALHDPASGGLAPGELAAFFRGSHFAVAYARPRPADPLPPGDVGGGVFTLVTDVGYRGRGVVWERLDTIDGDTTLVGADFRPPGCGAVAGDAEAEAAEPVPSLPPAAAEEADRALALRLQAEEDAAAERARASAAERRQAQQQAQQAQQAQAQRPLRRPGSGGLLGFGSGRRPSSGSGEKCSVM